MATVLVVDDDAPSREFMCALLNYRGHRIREACDGDSALAAVARQPPDAVITDVIMPGLDGYELARALRSEPTTRHIPIVFSTAHYGPQEIQPLVDAFDVHDVIFKPANPTTVLATIDALLVPGRASVPSADRVAETQRLTRSGTWELDAVTSTIIVSPELRDVLRLPSTELRLDELIRRVHPDDVAAITTMVENTWCTGAAGTAELRVADPEGIVHELIVSCRTTPARPSPTAAPALWGVAQDVTRIREKVRTDLRVQVDWHAVRRTIDAFHRAVLPRSLPTVAGAGLAAMYLPALERLDIGAAWYDALPLSGGRLLMSVGRVAGHDQHPAAVMGRVLAALNAYGYEDPDPAGVLARLNRLLTDTRRDDTYVTAVVAVFDPDTGRLRVANGGNPAPLVISRDRDGDAAAALLASDGPALGILPDAVFPELDVYLAPGSAFCAYTDGLIDRNGDLGHGKHLRRVAAQAFGRLSEDHPDRPPAAQFLADNIVGGMLGGAVPDDDVCLAVLYAGA